VKIGENSRSMMAGRTPNIEKLSAELGSALQTTLRRQSEKTTKMANGARPSIVFSSGSFSVRFLAVLYYQQDAPLRF
jgi:hypothetical protein